MTSHHSFDQQCIYICWWYDCLSSCLKDTRQGAQWPSGRVHDSIEGPVQASPASLRCGPWAKHIYPSLVLVQPRKTHPCLTERLLMVRKESNQTNKQKDTRPYLTASAESFLHGRSSGTWRCAWVKVLRIIPEFRILRMTFHRKSSSKY